jgi:DNA-binding NarL/FixJ family response regulator
MNRPQILLADDHALTLESMSAALSPHYEIAGTVADGGALLEAALRLKPDLIVLDITMPPLSGINAARQIKTSLPGTKLLFVTMHSSSAYVKAAFEAGGTGYVLKSAMREELLDAVESVLNGRIYVSPSLSTEHLEWFQDPL